MGVTYLILQQSTNDVNSLTAILQTIALTLPALAILIHLVAGDNVTDWLEDQGLQVEFEAKSLQLGLTAMMLLIIAALYTLFSLIVSPIELSISGMVIPPSYVASLLLLAVWMIIAGVIGQIFSANRRAREILDEQNQIKQQFRESIQRSPPTEVESNLYDAKISDSKPYELLRDEIINEVELWESKDELQNIYLRNKRMEEEADKRLSKALEEEDDERVIDRIVSETRGQMTHEDASQIIYLKSEDELNQDEAIEYSDLLSRYARLSRNLQSNTQKADNKEIERN